MVRMDIRIPLTKDQKKVITDATREMPDGMAAWARGVLLQAAEELLRQPGGEGQK